MGIVVGIDASRNRSGGAKAHILGILSQGNPSMCGIKKIHLWSYKALIDAIPDADWLVKHNPPVLEQSLIHQVLWQYRSLPQEAQKQGCNILLNTDAGTVCSFRPSIVMSRDMLSYEKCEMKRFGLSLARLRLILLKFIQSKSMKNADGVIFLTDYASKVIQKSTGKLSNIAIIPHGVGANFRQTSNIGEWDDAQHTNIRCIYVSNTLLYKHQWNVINAISKLRNGGFNISLLLVGGGDGKAQKMLDNEIALSDPKGEFVNQLDFVNHNKIPELIAGSDIFIFASSCENMPNTLVEGMSSGLPIASSDRGPMPEVLRDAGVYFNPEDSDSIAAAIEKIIIDKKLRTSIAVRARQLSEQYSWTRCAIETWEFLNVTASKLKSIKYGK